MSFENMLITLKEISKDYFLQWNIWNILLKKSFIKGILVNIIKHNTVIKLARSILKKTLS